MILYGAFNLVDMFMLSRLEEAPAALAALGVCDMLFALAVICATGVSNGSVAILGRRLGEGDLEGVQHSAWQSLLAMGTASIAVGVFGLLGTEWLITSLMQVPGEAGQLAETYLRIMLGGAFSIFFLLQITAILRALGHNRSAALLLVAGNALNVLLNAVLIYGPGPHPPLFAWAAPLAHFCDIPRLGMAGAAWATLIGRTVPVIIGAIYLVCLTDGLRLRRRFFIPQLRFQARLAQLGWPSSAQLVLRVASVLVFLALVAQAYTSTDDVSTLTAYSICLRLEVMVLFVGLGWGAAAATYMGVNLGAGQPARARRAGWLASAASAVTVAVGVGLFVLYADAIIAFFDPNPAVVTAGTRYLHIAALGYAALGLGVVLSQSLVGAGATMATFLLDLLVLVPIAIPAAYLVAITFALPASALWATMLAANLLSTTVFVIYYARGTFLNHRL